MHTQNIESCLIRKPVVPEKIMEKLMGHVISLDSRIFLRQCFYITYVSITIQPNPKNFQH